MKSKEKENDFKPNLIELDGFVAIPLSYVGWGDITSRICLNMVFSIRDETGDICNTCQNPIHCGCISPIYYWHILIAVGVECIDYFKEWM